MKEVQQEGILLQIAELGQPVLRKKARDISNINDEMIQDLIDDMIATVMEVDGVGIAAPQVYVPLRIVIIASHPNARYPHAPYVEPFAVINPKIVSVSDEKEKNWEGCLSVPGIRGFVPRNKSITVEYFTRDGKKQNKTYEDFVARIFQHEIDHVDGAVFLDQLESNKDIISEKEYQRILKKEQSENSKN